jgi:hypothetical protein
VKSLTKVTVDVDVLHNCLKAVWRPLFVEQLPMEPKVILVSPEVHEDLVAGGDSFTAALNCDYGSVKVMKDDSLMGTEVRIVIGSRRNA